MKYPRYILLLLLFVLTQSCAATQASRSVQPPTTEAKTTRVVKTRVKELSDCTGDRFRIDLLDAITKIPDDTLDAQREQLRDWIFTVTLARLAQTAGVDEIMTGVLTEPVFRDDTLAHVLRMQSGSTRSTSTKSGDVIVLVEAADAETMSAEMVEAVDEESLHLGNAPARAQVYQYVFQPEVARAEVCAMKPLTQADVESAGQRYRTATITTAAQFEQFLGGGVDLLSAQCTEAGLEVKGRQRPRTNRTPITVEHIAALSQARGARYVPVERFGYSLERESPKNRATLDHNAGVVDNLKGPLEIQSPEIQIVAGWKRQHPKVATQELFMSLDLLKRSFGRPGFSLDPHVSVSYSTYLLDELIAALPNVQKVAAIYRGLHEDERAKYIVELAESTQEPFAVQARAVLVDVRAKLAKAKPEEAEAILYKKFPKSIGNSIAEDMLREVGKHSSQQCSRYDGPFYGTATGMTFFYTDLLAKVWSIDWNGAAPEMDVEGFRSDTHGAVDTASCNSGVTGQNTRIWLGLREENFTREASGAVRFAPVVTRIFAKGSNAGARDVEFEATAESSRFVAWWNDHYGTIAALEPQYEVLNQLMKWSAVVHQASVADKDACFASLDAVPVRAEHRIDKWIAETAGLQWRGPVKLLPPPKGEVEKPGDPECMELLESRAFPFCDTTMTISGGVSAATRATITGKRIRSAEKIGALGRLSGEAKVARVADAGAEFAEVSRATGKLEKVRIEFTAQKAAFQAEVDVAASQRGIGASWNKDAPIRQIAKEVQKTDKGLKISERRNGQISSELTLRDLDSAAPKVEVKSSTFAEAKVKAQKIAERVAADGVDPITAARQEFGVADRIYDFGGGRLAWEIPGKSPKFAVMESAGSIRGPPHSVEASLTVGASRVTRRAGASEAFTSPTMKVEIVSESTFKKLMAERQGKPVDLADPTLTVIKGKLDTNDFEGAIKALPGDSSAKQYAAVLDHAFTTGDDIKIVRIIDHAIGAAPTPSKIRALRESLDLEMVRRTREGLSTTQLEQQSLRLAVAERKQAAVKKLGSAVSDPTPATVYTPPGYSLGSELPPSVHAPGKRLVPNEQFVTRTLDEVSVPKPPAELEVNGVKLARVTESAPTALDYTVYGSAVRLLWGARRPIHVVLPCNDRDATMAPCHERPSPESIQRYEEALKCDLNGDHELAGPEEIACLDVQAKKKEAEKRAPKQK